MNETLGATAITGFAHTLSTVIIGIIVGFVGIKLADNYNVIMTYIAPAILIAIGLVYIIVNFISYHHHHHHHHEHGLPKSRSNTKSKVAILSSLSLAMFLTPCIEIEAYYFQAGLIGWNGIFIVSAVYTLTTVMLMLVLVYIGIKGTQRLNSHFLEHHERLITGGVLVVLGVLAFFVKF